MNTGWLRLEKGVIAVPPKKTVKDGESTEIALTERTVNALRRWLEERENYAKYDDTDAVWLNRKKNRYNSDTLNYLLDKLCDEAGITQENRNISWYSIRRSVGTYLISEGSLAEAQTQLRHKNPESTMRYAESTPEERRNTLDKI
jgi:integrase